jgi:hypothetical protein
MILNESYWEHRYKTGNTGWDLGQLSQPLKTIIDEIENKNSRILIPGAGNAYEAEYLLEKGFKDITVLDLALPPLKYLESRIKDNKNIRIIHENYFNHIDNYDLILEQTFFCALEPRFRESYVKKSYELLRKNGHMEGVLFDFNSVSNNPPFTGTKDEYMNLFDTDFEILKLSRCLNSEKSREGKELVIKMKRK